MNHLIIAIISGVVGMIGWGFCDFFSAKAMKENKISEAQSSFLLYLVTASFSWLLVFGSNPQTITVSLPDLCKAVLFGGINVVVYLLFFKALNIGKLGTISTLFSTYSVGATVVSILFFSEPTSGIRILALGIIFLGIVCVSLQNVSEIKFIKGLPYVLAAAGIFSVTLPFLDIFLKSQNNWLFSNAIINSAMAILFYINLVKKEGKIRKLKLTLKTMTYAGAANTIGLVAISWGFVSTPLTSIIVVLSSAVALVSTLLGYIFFKERLVKTQYIGILAVVVGMAILFSS
jgi:drug/metabolite transporter (DMT)-like permease